MRGIFFGSLLGFCFWLAVIVGCRICFGATTIEYTPETLPRLYQQTIVRGPFNTHWNHQRSYYGPEFSRGRRNGWRSNPNLLNPWFRPAGTDAMPVVKARRSVTIPDGQWIECWVERVAKQPDERMYKQHPNGAMEQVAMPPSRPYGNWEYPLGTVLSEMLFDLKGEHFATRRLEKTGADHWDGEEDILFEPVGYVEHNRECMDCHQDAGKQAVSLRGHFPGREWYGHVSGNDGSFTARVLTPRNQIHPLFKEVTRWRGSSQALRTGNT